MNDKHKKKSFCKYLPIHQTFFHVYARRDARIVRALLVVGRVGGIRSGARWDPARRGVYHGIARVASSSQNALRSHELLSACLVLCFSSVQTIV